MSSPAKILILNGHPADVSLSQSLTQAYHGAAEAAGIQTRLYHLSQMDFDMDYGRAGYGDTKPLEPVLAKFLDDLDWCQHFVLTFPLWWGGMPAKLKGLMDRALLPGRTFSTRETTRLGLPKPLMKGRTARVMITADTPALFLRLAYGNAIRRQLSQQILGFIGLKPIRFSHFAGATQPKPKQIKTWIKTAETLGKRGA